MTCLACQEREHDCCGNLLQPDTCGCGCVRVLDPAAVVVILGMVPHDRRVCGRDYYNRQRRHKRRSRREVA